MAKIIIQKVNVYTGSVGGTLIGAINDVVVDSRELSVEPNQVTVDDGRNINESYTVNPTFRTRSTNFEGGSADGTAILSNAVISTDGTLPTEAYLEFVGAPNSVDIETGAMYINGHEAFDNGRTEIVLSGSLEVITASDGLTSNTASGS
tara:strand:- start:201 stop:647 length:447 start_codon:yes stop_codon:yes gene_type:complete